MAPFFHYRTILYFFPIFNRNRSGASPLIKRSPFEDGGSAISTTDLRLRIFPVPCCNLPFGLRKCKSILKKSQFSCFQSDVGISFPDRKRRMTDFSIQKWTNDPGFRTPLSGHLSSNVRVRFKEIRFYIPRFGVCPPPPARGGPRPGQKTSSLHHRRSFSHIGGFGK